MNKQEAAEFLGVSVRQIERYTKDNRLGARFEKGRTKPTPVYDEGELRRFKEALEQPVHRPAVHRMEGDSQTLATQSDGGLSPMSQLQALGKMMEALSQQGQARPSVDAVQAGAKLLLTLAEAQVLTGLSRAVLRSAIDTKKLKAQQIGRAWRIKRADLETYIGKL